MRTLRGVVFDVDIELVDCSGEGKYISLGSGCCLGQVYIPLGEVVGFVGGCCAQVRPVAVSAFSAKYTVTVSSAVAPRVISSPERKLLPIRVKFYRCFKAVAYNIHCCGLGLVEVGSLGEGHNRLACCK